jgi:hypothetical protein
LAMFEELVPPHYLCPISRGVLVDPVVAADGHTYERLTIVKWITERGTSPLTREQMDLNMLLPNHTLRHAIDYFFDHPPAGFSVPEAQGMRSEIRASHEMDLSTSSITVPDHVSPVFRPGGWEGSSSSGGNAQDFQTPVQSPRSRPSGETPESLRRPQRRRRSRSRPGAARRLTGLKSTLTEPPTQGDEFVLDDDDDDHDNLMKGIAASLLLSHRSSSPAPTEQFFACVYQCGLEFDSKEVTLSSCCDVFLLAH